MVVLDERILFNEIALMESTLAYKNLKYKHSLFNLYHDLTKYINKETPIFYDPKILNDGTFDKKLLEFLLNMILTLCIIIKKNRIQKNIMIYNYY